MGHSLSESCSQASCLTKRPGTSGMNSDESNESTKPLPETLGLIYVQGFA
jgi:hypothetical protein